MVPLEKLLTWRLGTRTHSNEFRLALADSVLPETTNTEIISSGPVSPTGPSLFPRAAGASR